LPSAVLLPMGNLVFLANLGESVKVICPDLFPWLPICPAPALSSLRTVRISLDTCKKL